MLKLSCAVTDQQLQQFYLFAGLNEPQLEHMKQYMRCLQLQEGECLFKQGENATQFFLVLKGHVKLTRLSPDGLEKVIEIISPGESFAEAVMFMPKRIYPVGSEAIDKTKLLSFESTSFLKLLRESFDTCLRVMGIMSQRIHLWLNEIDSLTLQNATYRLTSYLLYQLPVNTQGACEVNFAIPKHIIASRLSVKPETLSRILHHLTTEGLITVAKQTIHIHDIDRLRSYVQSSLGTTIR